VTASEDNSLFFFAVEDGQFKPIGFVETVARPSSLHWCPDAQSKKLLLCCEDGTVCEIQAPKVSRLG
jgi:hypothetical protein